MSIIESDKQVLLKLARSTIQKHLCIPTDDPLADMDSPFLNQKSGCFVTLEKSGSLRGCIGIIEAQKPLVTAVRENAVCAAFHDGRFSPVSASELSEITIEISVLTKPLELHFSNETELLSQLKPGVHGVILSKGCNRATFLPQVWDQLPEKVDFLNHLSRKAGLSPSCWRQAQTTIEVYEVEHFSESCING